MLYFVTIIFSSLCLWLLSLGQRLTNHSLQLKIQTISKNTWYRQQAKSTPKVWEINSTKTGVLGEFQWKQPEKYSIYKKLWSKFHMQMHLNYSCLLAHQFCLFQVSNLFCNWDLSITFPFFRFRDNICSHKQDSQQLSIKCFIITQWITSQHFRFVILSCRNQCVMTRFLPRMPINSIKPDCECPLFFFINYIAFQLMLEGRVFFLFPSWLFPLRDAVCMRACSGALALRHMESCGGWPAYGTDRSVAPLAPQ